MSDQQDDGPGKGLKEKRVLLSAAQEAALERLVGLMAEKLGTRVKASHLIRACLLLLRDAKPDIIARCTEVHGLARPSNIEALKVEEFERAIASIILAALRDIEADAE